MTASGAAGRLAAPDDLLSSFVTGFDEFLYFPAVPWGFSWQRAQAVIRAFAEAHADRPGYVFPPLGLLSHSPLRWQTWRKLGHAIGTRLGGGHRARAAATGYPMPGNLAAVRGLYLPGTGAWRRSVTLAVSSTFRRLRHKAAGSRRLVFASYVNDLVLTFAGTADFVVLDLAERRQASPLLSPYAKQLERTLAASADVLVADNRATLADYAAERAAHGRPGHYLPQGFTPSGRARSTATSEDAPIAYLGNLHGAIDYVWLERLVRRHPARTFRVCGAVLDARAHRVLACPNVEYWGALPHREIPEFLNGVAWGLIPYRLDDWTVGVFPTKLLEYLDCGVPVLSTAIPEVAQFGHLPFVRICSDPAAPLPAASMRGADAFLAEHTWAARMRAYGALLLESSR